MKFTKEQVKKVAKLVKLNLSDLELERLSVMFTDTLEKIRVLDELDTTNVPETYQVNGLENVFSDPVENKATLSKEAALKNAKQVIKGLIATDGVFDRE